MTDDPIEYSGWALSIRIGPYMRVALQRHLRTFVIEEIKKRGFDADDPQLFDEVKIELEAQELADEVIGKVETALNADPLTDIEDCIINRDKLSFSLEDVVREVLDRWLAETKEDFVINRLKFLVEWASGHFMGCPDG
jgi:hypothetical protein